MVTARKKTDEEPRSRSRGKSPAAKRGGAASERRDGEAKLNRKMAEDFLRRVASIKSANPDSSKVIDSSERIIHRSLWAIRDALDEMKVDERELVRILVLHGISKAAEEILLDDRET